MRGKSAGRRQARTPTNGSSSVDLPPLHEPSLLADCAVVDIDDRSRDTIRNGAPKLLTMLLGTAVNALHVVGQRGKRTDEKGIVEIGVRGEDQTEPFKQTPPEGLRVRLERGTQDAQHASQDLAAVAIVHATQSADREDVAADLGIPDLQAERLDDPRNGDLGGIARGDGDAEALEGSDRSAAVAAEEHGRHLGHGEPVVDLEIDLVGRTCTAGLLETVDAMLTVDQPVHVVHTTDDGEAEQVDVELPSESGRP